MIVNEKSLADRLEAKRDAGLVDIKFYVNRHAGASPDQVFDDALELQAALDDASLVEDFEFNDRHAA